MSAATIIRRIRDGGGEVRLAKDKLNLRLPENLHEALIREIKAEKEAIRRALKEEVGAGWDGDDYLSFFHERAAIRENDGGMSREWAESWAFEDVLAEWLNRKPEPSNSGHCAWCGATEHYGVRNVPYGIQGRGHTWLHPDCWPAWSLDRLERAHATLRNFGIVSSPYPGT